MCVIVNRSPSPSDAQVRLLFGPASRADSEAAEARAEGDSHYQPSSAAGPLVLELLRQISTDSLEKERDPREKEATLTVLETVLDAVPSAPAAEVARYQVDVIVLVLKHLLAIGVLSNGERFQNTLANIPAMAALLADRVCLLDSPLLVEEVLIATQALLRPIIDEVGTVYSFVEKAFGKSLTSAVVDALFRAVSRMHYSLLGRLSGRLSPEQISNVLSRMADAMPTFVLGQSNPDPLVVLCLSHAALDAWRKSLPPLLKNAWRSFWRQVSI